MVRKIEKICFKKSFEGKSQFSTWLYRVSINTALTFLNKEKKKTDNASLTENIDVQDENSDEKETQLEFFYKAVHELNPVEKALIFLLKKSLPILGLQKLTHV